MTPKQKKITAAYLTLYLIRLQYINISNYFKNILIES